jgi:hypothetical protein
MEVIATIFRDERTHSHRERLHLIGPALLLS